MSLFLQQTFWHILYYVMALMVRSLWFALLHSHDIPLNHLMLLNAPFTTRRANLLLPAYSPITSLQDGFVEEIMSALQLLPLLLAFEDSVHLKFFLLSVSPSQAWSRSFFFLLSQLWIKTILADSLVKWLELLLLLVQRCLLSRCLGSFSFLFFKHLLVDCWLFYCSSAGGLLVVIF